MATFTLSEIQEAAERKYAPTIINHENERFVMPNLMQQPAKKRDRILEIMDALDPEAEGESAMSISEQFETFGRIIEIATKDGKGERLLELIGDNSAVVSEIVTSWMEASQVGEPEHS